MKTDVIARRFRPQTFADVVGQTPVVRTLQNMIERGSVHHAHLFIGTRGTGKTSLGRILAKSLNCATGATPNPCGKCDSCVEISEGHSIDVMEIDAASNSGVDNIRGNVIETSEISPVRDRHKIFIIDEAHSLSAAAFNALLKTLEEPPPNVFFVLATTDPKKIPDTIISRCQVFEFRSIALPQIRIQLRHIANTLGIKIPDLAIHTIARFGQGSMRDAQSALDQVISFAGEAITLEDVHEILGIIDSDFLKRAVIAVAERNSGEMLAIVKDVFERGYEYRNFCRDLMREFRTLLAVKVMGFDADELGVDPGMETSMKEMAGEFSEADLLRYFNLLTQTEQHILKSSFPQFQLEMGLIKLVRCRDLALLEDMIRRFDALREQMTGQEEVWQKPTTLKVNELTARLSPPPLRSPAISPPIPQPPFGASPLPQAQAQPSPPPAEQPAQIESAKPQPFMGYTAETLASMFIEETKDLPNG